MAAGNSDGVVLENLNRAFSNLVQRQYATVCTIGEIVGFDNDKDPLDFGEDLVHFAWQAQMVSSELAKCSFGSAYQGERS